MCGIKGQKWIKKENKGKEVKKVTKKRDSYKPYDEWGDNELTYSRNGRRMGDFEIKISQSW